MCSDCNVAGMVSDMTVHWWGLACWPDVPISKFDVTEILGGLGIRFGRIRLSPAGVTPVMLLMV